MDVLFLVNFHLASNTNNLNVFEFKVIPFKMGLAKI